MTVAVQRIDYVERVLFTDDDRRLPIAYLFDRAGLPTEESNQAVLCVAGGPGAWVSLKLAPYSKQALQ